MNKIKKKNFKPHYSTRKSKKIWDSINSIKGSEGSVLYSCFVLLQNMEGTCLCWLNNAIVKKQVSK